MKPQTKIITCKLPLPIQRLYIKRLKHMIWRWEHENFCGHCPINKRFETRASKIKKFKQYGVCWVICDFCKKNVRAKTYCPCVELKPKTALKRAKDFIERFEAEDGGKRC